ncbi:MAG: amidohydrolase family protein [Eubacteriales bacterium]|nr:amidohydrolase family protein [Eubacteriales bacterium]MDD3880809.1 amidohydrolase family protein [Eubacteriales bacterium]MDD4511824.1 amidohydrolase family protein [Eubacteriales bacterium]
MYNIICISFMIIAEAITISFIYDVHAHIFPDKIAKRASEMIGGFYSLEMAAEGTVSELLKLGGKAGINKYMVHSVAVVPKNAVHINDFVASTVNSNPKLFTGFLTLHPDMENMEAELERAMGLGLKGVKIHPDMQKFALDDKGADKLFAICEGVCPVLIHTGDPRYSYSNPEQMARVLKNHPRLTAICAHLGGWGEWTDAARVLADKNVYVDTSSSLYAITKEEARAAIDAYGYERVLFGTDYPMWDATQELERFHALGLSDKAEEMILGKNLLALLGETAE